MNEQAFLKEANSKDAEVPFQELAILASNERICTNAQTCLDPDSIRRFCQVWGEVGRAILGRRIGVAA
jgi:hypothetical protein